MFIIPNFSTEHGHNIYKNESRAGLIDKGKLPIIYKQQNKSDNFIRIAP